ncbi:MAG: hypothetical protein ACI92E_002006, partial [Oceanicoccus sp.]
NPTFFNAIELTWQYPLGYKTYCITIELILE